MASITEAKSFYLLCPIRFYFRGDLIAARGQITENLFFVAGTEAEGKPMLTVMLSDNLVAGGLKAGNLVKEAAKLIQGGGGGQPHFATAGGKNVDGLNAAIDKVLELAGL